MDSDVNPYFNKNTDRTTNINNQGTLSDRLVNNKSVSKEQHGISHMSHATNQSVYRSK